MDCTVQSLAAAAKCFECLSPGQKEAIKTYLLAVRAGGSTDPNVLLDQAKCFTCLNALELQQLQAYLLCKILP
jgi:hypothetical protein